MKRAVKVIILLGSMIASMYFFYWLSDAKLPAENCIGFGFILWLAIWVKISRIYRTIKDNQRWQQ